MNKPTVPQYRVLRFIAEYMEREMMPPTHDEIRVHFGWQSQNSAATHIALLKKKSCLETRKYQARFLRITPWGHECLKEMGEMEELQHD